MNEEKSKRTRIIGLRLSPEEYKEIDRRWKMSNSRRLSDYARKKLFDKAIIKSFRNLSLDDMMIEMIQLRKTLDGIANNLEQSMKKMMTSEGKSDLKIWSAIQDNQRNQILIKIEEIKKRINLIADKWLQ
jgi:hypothetical protein